MPVYVLQDLPTKKNTWIRSLQTIDDVISRLKATAEPTRPEAASQALKALHQTMQQKSQARRRLIGQGQLDLAQISPRLAAIDASLIPMPGEDRGGVCIREIQNAFFILPTKTKPKKLIFVGDNGQRYPYLFKGAYLFFCECVMREVRIAWFITEQRISVLLCLFASVLHLISHTALWLTVSFSSLHFSLWCGCKRRHYHRVLVCTITSTFFSWQSTVSSAKFATSPQEILESLAATFSFSAEVCCLFLFHLSDGNALFCSSQPAWFDFVSGHVFMRVNSVWKDSCFFWGTDSFTWIATWQLETWWMDVINFLYISLKVRSFTLCVLLCKDF